MPSSPIPAARSQYLLDLLAQVPDPRKRRGRRHALAGLLAVGIAAVIAGSRSFAAIENDEYAAFARRVLRAYARRIAGGDVEPLIPMFSLAAEIDTAITGAVKGLRASGYSWAEIGSRLGITRQAAQQRWGRPA
jgi:DDE_Tnp_1-associated